MRRQEKRKIVMATARAMCTTRKNIARGAGLQHFEVTTAGYGAGEKSSTPHAESAPTHGLSGMTRRRLRK